MDQRRAAELFDELDEQCHGAPWTSSEVEDRDGRPAKPGGKGWFNGGLMGFNQQKW